MRIVRFVGIVLLAVVVVAVVLAIAARFSDGPIGPFPGGKLRSGTRVADPNVDWRAATAGASHLELEVNPGAARSVTTSFVIRDDKLYVPSILAARKRWPREALADGRVVVRVGGKLYDRYAARVTDPVELRPLLGVGGTGDLDPNTLTTWYFRLDPRG